MFDFVLFTTSDKSSNRDALLSRMLAALEMSVAGHRNVSAKIYLLMQRAGPNEKREFPKWVSLYRTNEQISLSSARNFLIKMAHENGDISSDTICAFPDDDSWYPASFLANVKQLFIEKPSLGFWFCRYSSNPLGVKKIVSAKPTLQQTISFASSNTIFIRGSTFKKLNGFNEKLGVGASIQGGEDTEFAIQAFFSDSVSNFTNFALVGHRDSNRLLKARYFPGSLFAISRHQRGVRARTAYFRKILVGLTQVALGRLSLGIYCRAVISSLGAISPQKTGLDNL